MKIKFSKVKNGAKIPTQVPGSTGLDFYACFDEEYMIIKPHETKLIPTGVRVIMGSGFFMLLEERGSTGSKGIKRSAGVVDPDYRGEIFVCIYNANDSNLCITKDMNQPVFVESNDGFLRMDKNTIYYPYEKAIAQGIVLPSYIVESVEISEEEYNIHVTGRADGSLGSTGK